MLLAGSIARTWKLWLPTPSPLIRCRASAGRETTVVEVALEGAFGLIRSKSERRTRAGRHGSWFPRDTGNRRGSVDIPRVECRRRIDIASRVDRTHAESVFAGRQTCIRRRAGTRGEHCGVEAALKGRRRFVRGEPEVRVRDVGHRRRIRRDAGSWHRPVDCPGKACRRRIDAFCWIDRPYLEGVVAIRQTRVFF